MPNGGEGYLGEGTLSRIFEVSAILLKQSV